MSATVTVNGPAPYEVKVGAGLLPEVVAKVSSLAASQVAIIHQPSMAPAARKLLAHMRREVSQAHLLEIADAEAGKTLQVCESLWDELGRHAFGRRDVIVTLGGGAATDLGGFVAAAWMRGVKVIHVPTTLLAMVDAAVGGKTGVNTRAGKNLVGAFHEPSAVFVDVDFLRTLPTRDLVAGSAEIIKTGFIADERILELYESDPRQCTQPGEVLSELIYRSIAVKAKVVGQDLKESSLREILNYGHTFAHAVEQHENYRWRHGDAVAVGMAFIAELSRGRGLIDETLARRHTMIMESVGLPVTYEAGHFDSLYTAMTRDKKNRDGRVRFVALDGGVGTHTRIEDAGFDELRSVYDALCAQ